MKKDSLAKEIVRNILIVCVEISTLPEKERSIIMNFVHNEMAGEKFFLLSRLGTVADLVAPKTASLRYSIINELENLAKKGASRIFIIGHENCVAYESERFHGHSEKKKQLHDLRAAKKVILNDFKHHISWDIELYFLGSDAEGKINLNQIE